MRPASTFPPSPISIRSSRSARRRSLWTPSARRSRSAPARRPAPSATSTPASYPGRRCSSTSSAAASTISTPSGSRSRSSASAISRSRSRVRTSSSTSRSARQRRWSAHRSPARRSHFPPGTAFRAPRPPSPARPVSIASSSWARPAWPTDRRSASRTRVAGTTAPAILRGSTRARRRRWRRAPSSTSASTAPAASRSIRARSTAMRSLFPAPGSIRLHSTRRMRRRSSATARPSATT